MSLITDTKYINLLSPRLERFKRVRDYIWNFRCPICGDSHKNKSKARGYIHRRKNDLYYKCHNCSVGLSLGNLIKEVDPTLYNEYVLERYKAGETGKGKSKTPDFKFEAPVFKPKPVDIGLPSIHDLDTEHYAKVYVKNRLIPERYHKRLFFTEDFREWANRVSSIDYSNLQRQEPRLVIPFFDQNGLLIGAQGRSLGQSKLRYVTIKTHDEAQKLYGLERWKPEDHTYLVEGPIDSLFLPNSIAMAGADGRDIEDLLDKSKTTIVLDNEPRNLEIVNRMDRLLADGWSVCIWPEKVIYKDINEMILRDMSVDLILELINKNTHSGLEGLWQLQYWKKI